MCVHMEKTQRIDIRVTPRALNRIRLLAEVYAAGDMTKWITYAALNVKPKYLVPINAKVERKWKSSVRGT